MKNVEMKLKLNDYVAKDVLITLASGDTIQAYFGRAIGSCEELLYLNQMSGLTQSAILISEITDVQLAKHCA